MTPLPTPAVRPPTNPLAPTQPQAHDDPTAPRFGDELKKASSQAATPAPTPDDASTQAAPKAKKNADGKDDKGDDTTADAAADTLPTLPVTLPATVTPVATGMLDTLPSDKPADTTADTTAPADQGMAAAMLALIGGTPTPLPNTLPTTPAAPAPKAQGTLADGIAAAMSVSSKVAAALSGGAPATAVAVGAGVAADVLGAGKDAISSLLSSALGAIEPTKADAQTAAQLAGSQLSQPSAPVAPPVPLQSTQVVGTPAFAQELGDQIAWMGNSDIKQASIRLNPQDMGQLDVKISMDHNRVDVVFAAQHPAAVTAVQQTLTQLDTMLAHHGLQLGDAQVGQQQHSGQGGPNQGQAGDGQGGDVADVAQAPAVVRVTQGLVDDFA